MGVLDDFSCDLRAAIPLFAALTDNLVKNMHLLTMAMPCAEMIYFLRCFLHFLGHACEFLCL